MKKKLLAALVLSLAMAAPQAKADPTPHDLYDTMVAGGDKVSLWTNQLINADLPKYTYQGLEINPYDETTQEPIGGYSVSKVTITIRDLNWMMVPGS